MLAELASATRLLKDSLLSRRQAGISLRWLLHASLHLPHTLPLLFFNSVPFRPRLALPRGCTLPQLRNSLRALSRKSRKIWTRERPRFGISWSASLRPPTSSCETSREAAAPCMASTSAPRSSVASTCSNSNVWSTPLSVTWSSSGMASRSRPACLEEKEHGRKVREG